MENPIKMDDLGVPLFKETTIYIFLYLVVQQQLLHTQVDYEVMKVENHELRKRVLAAQGDGGISTSTERCCSDLFPAAWSPQMVVNSKGNPLQHPVLSGLGNIVSCPDD